MIEPGSRRWRVVVAALGAVGLLALVGGGSSVGVADPTRSPDAFTDQLDARLPELMDRYQVPGVSIAIVRDGQVAWTGAYGTAHAVDQRPLTVDTVFRAESISKPVTA